MADWDLPRDPLAALRDGDPAPFEAFVRDHARRLFAFFRRQGAGVHRAEDLTQEVFLKLYRHSPRYRAQERFPAFCLRVARNVWIDDRRRAAARVSSSAAAPAGEPVDAAPAERALPDPHEWAELRDETDRLRAAVRELPEHHRSVFELGVLEGLSYPEIAALLDVPLGTVKSRMFHAVRRLRRAVGADDEEGVA